MSSSSWCSLIGVEATEVAVAVDATADGRVDVAPG